MGLTFWGVISEKTSQMVAAENAIFRTTLMKKCKKIILPKLDRIFKTNFPTTCWEYKITSNQVGRK